MEKKPFISKNSTAKPHFLQYIDRSTHKMCVESIHGEWALRLLYEEGFFSRLLLPLVSKFSTASRVYGWLMKRSWTRAFVTPFINTYSINRSEFQKQKFDSFNDFFTRKLKKEARPIDSDLKKLIFPADARFLAYSKIDQIRAKGKSFSLEELLGDAALAQKYVHGSMLIARLCPVDYHRFHFPCDATASKAKLIQGPLFSVSPMALKKRLSILWENKRMVTELDTTHFGKIAYVEIGATNVGSICQTYEAKKEVKKGDEKGYFEFGGSCLILLFESGSVAIDSDLLQNTQNGLETYAKMGESFAIKK